MKILVILLVIGILLFVVLIVWGAGQPKLPSNSNSRQDSDTFNQEPHPYLDGFKGMFGRFGPTLKAGSLNPELSTFDLASKSSYSLVVLGDDKHKFRQAKFVVQPGQLPLCAHVKYTAFGGKDMDDHLKNQDSNDDKDPKKKPPNEFTLTIAEGGGRLTVERNPPLTPGSPPGPCSVQLK